MLRIKKSVAALAPSAKVYHAKLAVAHHYRELLLKLLFVFWR